MSESESWIKRMRPVTDARLRLICIPYAGGGAWSFRPWPQHLPADVEVLSVQLPGREDRLADEPFTRVGPLVAQLTEVVQPLLDKPCAFFGHSMGALLCFELLRELRRRGAPTAAHLFASGYRAPQLPARNPPIHELLDKDFVDEVSRLYDAIPPAAREHEELMELLLPGLRADIAVCDTYVHTEDAPLDCSITALGGHGDGDVDEAQLTAWGAQTTGTFALQMFDGGHFFIQSALAPVLEAVTAQLRRSVP